MISEKINRVITVFLIMAMIITSVPTIAYAQSIYNSDQQKISGVHDSNVTLPNLEYRENTFDLRVKVLGGEVKLNRTWMNGRWSINPAWDNLRFVLDPLDSSVKIIDRAGTMYQRTGNQQLYTYKQVAIKKTDSGWRWFDQQGNWINFDQQGRILEYGDINNIKVSFLLDPEGRRMAIKDHFDEVVYRFSYDNQEHLTQVIDRAGRTVSYQWSGDLLIKVTDVMGNQWLYGYDSQGQLNQKTAPDGGITKIDYTVSTPAPKTAMTSGFEGGVVSHNAVVTSGAANRDTRLAQVGKITDKTGTVTIYNLEYNRSNKQYTITINDSIGKKTVTVFNSQGQIITEKVNDSLTKHYQRDTANHIVKYTDLRGLTTSIQYNQANYPIKIAYPNGATELYEYNNANKPIKITTVKGEVINFEYDTTLNLTKINMAVGKPEQLVINIAYDEFGQQILTTINGNNKSIEFHSTYDKYGNMVTYTDGNGYQYQYTYNIHGQIKTTTDPLQHKWQFNYNLAGDLTEVIDPLNHSRYFTNDWMGRLTKVTDALGNNTKYQYTFNPNGYETKVTNALNQTTTYQYDNLYRLVKTISPSGLVSLKTYDLNDNLIQDVDVAGNSLTYQYGEKGSNLANLLVKIVYPTFSETYNYDALGNITEINQILNANTTLTNRQIYDQSGLLTSIVDADLRTSQIKYNSLGQAVKSINPLGYETSYMLNFLGNITQMTDANGNQYLFEFDNNNNLIKETKALGNNVTYSYNAINQLIEQTQANGNRIEYQYDAAGNKIKQNYFSKDQSVPDQEITYHYNEADQLIEVLQAGDTNSHFIYQRDALGRITQETITYGSDSNKVTKILKYGYDQEGNLVSLSYPDNTTVHYSYDKNQLIQATLANGEVINWSDYQWFMPTKVTYPNATETIQYDPLLRPLQIDVTSNDKTLLNRQYTYDKVGNIVRIQTENGDNTYQYDALDQLTFAKPSGEIQNLGIAVESYHYDAIGNRISSAQQPDEWTYNQFNQLTSWGEDDNQTILTYTPNGQLASESRADKTVTYHYNAADRLSQINQDNSLVASYQYDAFGRRFSKTVNGVTNYFIYTDEGLIAELDDRGNLTTAYGWLPDTEWGTNPLWQASVTTNQTLQTATYHYLITDHLGTPQLAINSQGQQTWKIHSDTFGNTVLDPNNQITLNLRFPGQYYDQETGLSYNYFRDYNPQIGRYIQSDPIGIMGGINTYNYATDNPLIYRDPYGKNVLPLFGLIAVPAAAILVAEIAAGLAIGLLVYEIANEIVNYDNSYCSKNKNKNKNNPNNVDNSALSTAAPPPNNNDDDDDKKKIQYKKTVSNKSGKEKADGVPTWAKGERPMVGENGNQFAERLMRKKYGDDWRAKFIKENKSIKGAGSEFNQISKWGNRAFE